MIAQQPAAQSCKTGLTNSVNLLPAPVLPAGRNIRIGAPPQPKPAQAQPMIIQTARLVLAPPAAIALSVILFQSPAVINQIEAGPRVVVAALGITLVLVVWLIIIGMAVNGTLILAVRAIIVVSGLMAAGVIPATVMVARVLIMIVLIALIVRQPAMRI